MKNNSLLFLLDKSHSEIGWQRRFRIHKFWSRYLLQYKRDINKSIVEKSAVYGKEAQGQIIETMAISSTGYIVSYCQDEPNKIMTDFSFNNRQNKH